MTHGNSRKKFCHFSWAWPMCVNAFLLFLLVDWSWSTWKSITLSKHKGFSSIMASLFIYPWNLSFFFALGVWSLSLSDPRLCILAPHCGYTHYGITDSWMGSMYVNWSCIAYPESSLTHQTISVAPTFLNLKRVQIWSGQYKS